MATVKRRAPGNASVAGKIVYIRHATAWDIDTIRNEKMVREEDIPDLVPERVVVAAEEDTIIGLGIVTGSAKDGNVRVKVFAKKGRKNIGSSIVSHVLESGGLVREEGRSEHAPKVIVSRRKSGEVMEHGKGRRHRD